MSEQNFKMECLVSGSNQNIGHTSPNSSYQKLKICISKINKKLVINECKHRYSKTLKFQWHLPLQNIISCVQFIMLLLLTPMSITQGVTK